MTAIYKTIFDKLVLIWMKKVRRDLQWRRRLRERGAGWRPWQGRGPLLYPLTAPDASAAPDRWRQTTCRVSPPAKEHQTTLNSLTKFEKFFSLVKPSDPLIKNQISNKVFMQRWISAIGSSHIWLTNRSSFHLNHHSWMLPFSSKSLEMGHREKTPSKIPWR